MTIVLQNKIITVIAFVSVISHLTFLHPFMQNYVICYGADKHIAIENFDDRDNYSEQHSSDLSYESAKVFLRTVDCEDISLNNKCFEDEQILSINKFYVNLEFQKIKDFALQKNNHKQVFKFVNTNKSENTILSNYITVSLLI